MRPSSRRRAAAAPSPAKHRRGGAGPPRPRRGVAPGSLSRAFRTRRDAAPRRRSRRTCVSAARRRSSPTPTARASIAWRHIYPNNMRDIAFRTHRRIAARRRRRAHQRRSVATRRLPGRRSGDGEGGRRPHSRRLADAWSRATRPSKGIFYASTNDRRVFSARVRLDDGTSRAASHPQLTRVGATGLAVLWDEPVEGSRRVLLRHRPSTSAPVVASRGVARRGARVLSGRRVSPRCAVGGLDERDHAALDDRGVLAADLTVSQ